MESIKENNELQQIYHANVYIACAARGANIENKQLISCCPKLEVYILYLFGCIDQYYLDQSLSWVKIQDLNLQNSLNLNPLINQKRINQSVKQISMLQQMIKIDVDAILKSGSAQLKLARIDTLLPMHAANI